MLALIPSVEPSERASVGQSANSVKTELQSEYDAAMSALSTGPTAESLDVTLPGVPPVVGGLHVTRQTMYEIQCIFATMGFTVFESNEVETDEYNFQLLNIPPEHPSRDMWDTMYLEEGQVLRTHTSPGQIRAMQRFHPEPIRIILPGRCYRYEAIDASHESILFQVEGLAIGTGITLASLKGVFEAFARQFFGKDRGVRFRGHYFPFTEPSVEIDISCNCEGRGCPVCKGTGWLELSGGGMVHPIVLENGGYDPAEVTGFAFGMGADRAAMLKHNIEDIRLLYTNDLRFLEQFT